MQIWHKLEFILPLVCQKSIYLEFSQTIIQSFILTRSVVSLFNIALTYIVVYRFNLYNRSSFNLNLRNREKI